MNSQISHLSPAITMHRAGSLLLVLGACAIYLEYGIKLVFMISHTIYDVVPSVLWINQLESLLFILIPAIGVPSILMLFICSTSYLKAPRLFFGVCSSIMVVTTSLAINAALMIGGGWYVGTIAGDAGLIMLLTSVVMHEKTGLRLRKDMLDRSMKKKVVMIQGILLVIVFAGGIWMSIVPMITGMNSIPDPLIRDATAKPSSVVPNHANTFYILPIWEWQGNNYTYGKQQLNYMKKILGGDAYTGNGFVRIGRSMSCWYTGDTYDNGTFNPTHLIEDLTLSNMTNAPILFHMNGGNWGGCCNNVSGIFALRNDTANCQCDQKNWYPPIVFLPGPNNRYWSLAPNTAWEHLRESNIKKALGIIKNWSNKNPGLLVGFSTDSEIHEEDSYFTNATKTYRSYFDYNPLSITQYRGWAQANWSLTDFNTRCGTNFGTWADVDAPRSADVVGKVGNPWWETWTNFRIWQVTQAIQRQCQWINESGFPRDMIWNHQILSEPGDTSARYQRCDPLETSVNPYCKVGVTRYGWLTPQMWHSLGQLALEDGAGDTIPSWGIFEWNLWTQHQYWAFREMLNCIYQYGGHVICPNEWANCSINEGLWIPGDDLPSGVGSGVNDPNCTAPGFCCQFRNATNNNCTSCKRCHGNPQFQAALRDFVALAQDYERGTCPSLRVNKLTVWYYDGYLDSMNYFTGRTGLYIMVGGWLACMIFMIVALGMISAARKRRV